LIQNFQVNSLNELTANTNDGTLTVMGTTTSRATNVTVSIAANTTFQYDGNGNLTSDGLRSLAYDDENQLIQVLVTNQYCSQFTYDGKMRRRTRLEYAYQGGNWVQTNEVYYVYDGNEVIQERNINKLPATTYTRGKDLSGSLEGAGGIGGLLSMTLNTELGTTSSNSYFYHADGNGNVTMLINPSQYTVAKYLYDAFGNILSKSGLLADANLYRFSSKEAHPNSGLVYYLYRYYDPNLQRWPNRDPLGEPGFEKIRDVKFPTARLRKVRAFGESLQNFDSYTFVRNKPTYLADLFGLWPVEGDANPGGVNGVPCITATLNTATGQVTTCDNASQLEQSLLLAEWAASAAAAAAATAEELGLGLRVDGPAERGGRICQLRLGPYPILRLDYHPIPGSAGQPVLHLNIGPWHIPVEWEPYW
jgi:RHS repeat-associated protein